MSIAFKIDVQPQAVIYSISGRMNTEDATAGLMNAITEQLEKDTRNILLDISGLEYITSSGLNFFIRTLTRTRNAGGELIICGLHGTVEKLFVISKLNEIFTICPDIATGLAKINAQ